MVSITLKAKKNQKSVKLPVGETRRLFSVVSGLADSLEDILESRGDYNSEFLSGLSKSLSELKSGKTFKISSLSNLR